MITSLDNAKVKHARELLHQRKARERERQFVVEGARLVQEMSRAGIEPALLFFAEAFAKSPLGQHLATRYSRALELVSDKVFASLSDTQAPQGVLAVVPFPRIAAAKHDLLLIADMLRDPGNLGTLLRSATAAGVDEALISVSSADVFSPKVVRAAMGAHFRLAIQQNLSCSHIAERVRGMAVLLADADGEVVYDNWDWKQPSALVVGGEAEGASAEGRALATERIRIPMHADTESLNAAVAGSIILFEAARQRRSA
ncbi:MAG: RNA methyltransferase [Chloroflexi bacterium]|nr:RNA methyltransferase [Chloroflexota bacterium]